MEIEVLIFSTEDFKSKWNNTGCSYNFVWYNSIYYIGSFDFTKTFFQQPHRSFFTSRNQLDWSIYTALISYSLTMGPVCKHFCHVISRRTF